jgi:hypothetical protein
VHSKVGPVAVLLKARLVDLDGDNHPSIRIDAVQPANARDSGF